MLWLEGPVRSPLSFQVKQEVSVQLRSPVRREGKVFGVFSCSAALCPILLRPFSNVGCSLHKLDCGSVTQLIFSFQTSGCAGLREQEQRREDTREGHVCSLSGSRKD